MSLDPILCIFWRQTSELSVGRHNQSVHQILSKTNLLQQHSCQIYKAFCGQAQFTKLILQQADKGLALPPIKENTGSIFKSSFSCESCICYKSGRIYIYKILSLEYKSKRTFRIWSEFQCKQLGQTSFCSEGSSGSSAAAGLLSERHLILVQIKENIQDIIFKI